MTFLATDSLALSNATYRIILANSSLEAAAMNRSLGSLIAVLLLFLLMGLNVQAANLSPAEIIASSGPGTVVIKVQTTSGSVSTGSGFMVNPSGVVVTNFHVVEGAKKIQIRLSSGDVYDVIGIRGVDQRRDLAVLQVLGFDLPTVRLGNSNKVRTGERIVVIGTALGLLENSVTTGVVSGIRQLEGYRLFQMDAAVSPGNSGGPVVNEQGEVIAVTVGKLSEGESLNFAVPINYARGLMQGKLEDGLAKLTGEHAGVEKGLKEPAGIQRALKECEEYYRRVGGTGTFSASVKHCATQPDHAAHRKGGVTQ
jgi:S1-C subfamily serine protease